MMYMLDSCDVFGVEVAPLYKILPGSCLLFVILDCKSVLLLGGILGHVELCEDVSSWHPMC